MHETITTTFIVIALIAFSINMLYWAATAKKSSKLNDLKLKNETTEAEIKTLELELLKRKLLRISTKR